MGKSMEHPVAAAIYKISAVAEMLNLHPRTLRNYEHAGLIKPARRGAWRYYSATDIAWLRCLHAMIHERGITIASIAKLLKYAPCWEVTDCPESKRGQCPVFLARQKKKF
ncbi:MerR family transcriptional regulator [Thiovibrio sp. JS02]